MRLIHYIKLRHKGVGRRKAAKVTGLFTLGGNAITIIMSVSIVFGTLINREKEADARLKATESVLKYHQARIQAEAAVADTHNLENVVIRCLRGDVVMINNHTHECVMRKL
jgi:hypothetical protein